MGSKRAFTLTELLVVVAILGILAALLLSALSRAHANARRTTCLNNLHQINFGLRMYVDDASDKSPNAGELTYITYKEVMKSYVGLGGPSSGQDKICACPSDTWCYDSNTANAYFSSHGRHEAEWSDYSSYSFNGMNLRHTPWGPQQRPGIGGRTLSSIKTPAKTILVAEAAANWPYSWHDPLRPLIIQNAHFKDSKNMVSFVDGHVNYIKMYWDHGSASFYDPPANYDYKWSGD